MRKMMFRVCMTLLGASILLIGCAGSGSDQAVVSTLSPEQLPTATAEIPIEVNAAQLQIVVPATDFEADSPRVPFTVIDRGNQVSDIQAVEITLFDLSFNEPVAIWTGDATNYSDFEVPYWVVYPPIETEGLWGLQANLTLRDGSQAPVNFAIETVVDTQAPNIGENVPLSENRTSTTHPISALSSDRNPDPTLYENTVPELLTSYDLSVISFTTPAYCQTAVCAPVIEAIKESKATYEDEVGYMHLEIFKTFDPLETADEVFEWNLPSEPWTFVVRGDSTVVARLAGPVSAQELAEILESN